MATEKARISKRGILRLTKKKTGYITTSIRLLADENRQLRKHAASVGISFNGWAVQTLLEAAKKGNEK